MFPPCREVSETLASSHLGLPTDVLDGLWYLLQARLKMAADLGWIPVGPRPLDEGSAGERVAGFGDGALATAFATGVLTGGESQIAHELSRVLEACQVAEFSDEGDGHRELDAAHGLESLDDGIQAPGLDLVLEFGLEALEAFVVFGNAPDILLEDHLLSRSRTDHLTEPTQMRRPPGGTAFITDILTQQKGLQTALGGLEIPDGILAGAGQVADGLVLDLGDVDRREIPGAHQPSEPHGITSVSLDTVAWFLRGERRGNHPADEVLLGEVAV
jgi:hypothetical protein